MSSTQPPINFTRGVPADESYPLEQVADCAGSVLTGKYGTLSMQYGSSLGFLPLREWLAAQHNVTPDHVMLGNGSLQLVDFLAHGLLEPGDLVLVESPTYDRTLTLLRRAGARVQGVPLEHDGLDIAALEALLEQETPKYIYLITDFQNPSGATTSLPKRQRIVELAEQYGFGLIEDAPYRPLRYRGQAIPTLHELAPKRTLHMSSFTKQISPGVRVGYMVGEPARIKQLAKVAEDTYIAPNVLGQAIVYEFCDRGLLEPQLERLRKLYGARLEAIGAALRAELPEARWIEPDGGFFLSVWLPQGVSNAELRQRAVEVKLNLTDGRAFFPNANDGDRFLRLPFCALTADQIKEGVRRLASIAG
ncbi:MAG: PLP-dependent aminotransferase family protein [Chloroflexota bacterium]|nr:PLP-dependent aminotransferase family protein [Chloroflexota bacterium]